MSTSSTNIESGHGSTKFRLLQRQDADDPSVRAVILEPDPAIDLREDGVVFAASGVESPAGTGARADGR
jgi:hypothetical protein